MWAGGATNRGAGVARGEGSPRNGVLVGTTFAAAAAAAGSVAHLSRADV